jgi:hypothetical protein
MYRQAVEGDCTNPDLMLDNTKKELHRMAQGADNYSFLLQYLRDVEKADDNQIRNMLEQGKALLEFDRNTVKESDDA